MSVIVVNRHRTVRDVERQGLIGGVVTVRETSSQWWVVFVRRYPWNLWKPFTAEEPCINHGWHALRGVRLAPCNGGWACDMGELTVFAPDLVVVESPYDYDLHHRSVYKPLKGTP